MTKLEEIALAIHRARYPDAPAMDGIEGLGPAVAAQALVEARAAMEAMRIPPSDIVVDIQRRNIPNHSGVAVVWMDIIDAILNKKPGA